MFAEVKASCYIIIKIIVVFLTLEEKSHYFSVAGSSVALPGARCLADVVRFQLEGLHQQGMNKVNWQCTIKSLFKLNVQGVGLGGNLISAIIPGVSETAQILVSVSGSQSLVCKCSILLFSNPGLANLWFKILLSSL